TGGCETGGCSTRVNNTERQQRYKLTTIDTHRAGERSQSKTPRKSEILYALTFLETRKQR
ncbi:MAG: hypothetical protein ACPH9W_09685, partial [Pseudomonadales bacterium]